ncbi:hypothetical protein GCM10010211_51820 [Streptomyces albospinus]|uniref:Uncharacterized protein n=1 Tax=Streptomyces albospinus TaxID=285515 RepID=A0ABQ2VC78_9ACTN|nr:hypothetical protein GCM10010211_51820 [Streptomyces albospinus]
MTKRGATRHATIRRAFGLVAATAMATGALIGGTSTAVAQSSAGVSPASVQNPPPDPSNSDSNQYSSPGGNLYYRGHERGESLGRDQAHLDWHHGRTGRVFEPPSGKGHDTYDYGLWEGARHGYSMTIQWHLHHTLGVDTITGNRLHPTHSR